MEQTLDAFESGPALGEVYDMEAAELLGRGKFSVVHRTRRLSDGVPVALKTIQIFEMASKERHECMNEIRLLQQMQHLHIICYLDCKLERNELTVVMECAGHGDLATLIRDATKAEAPLGEAAVWRHFAQIADALAYMHERRVMHRDIKPANVFISNGGSSSSSSGGGGGAAAAAVGDEGEGSSADGGAATVMKLGDLGLGRYFSSKTDVTHSTVGTPYYMSPECIQGGGYDFKSDIWSLGCLLYELATLRSPFYSAGLNFYMLGKRIMKRQFEPLGAVSPEMVSLVDRMLQLDPADRPTAAEVYEIAAAAAAAHAEISAGWAHA
jgi:serine/threonine protein kinase